MFIFMHYIHHLSVYSALSEKNIEHVTRQSLFQTINKYSVSWAGSLILCVSVCVCLCSCVRPYMQPQMAAVSPAIWMWTSILEYPRTKWLHPDPETDSTPTDVTYSRMKQISGCCICYSSITHHLAVWKQRSLGIPMAQTAINTPIHANIEANLQTKCACEANTRLLLHHGKVRHDPGSECKWQSCEVVCSLPDSFTIVRLSYCEIIDYDASLFQLVSLCNSHWSTQRFPFAFCWLKQLNCSVFHTICFIIVQE